MLWGGGGGHLVESQIYTAFNHNNCCHKADILKISFCFDMKKDESFSCRIFYQSILLFLALWGVSEMSKIHLLYYRLRFYWLSSFPHS